MATEQTRAELTVIKVGGNELDDPAFLEGFCSTLAAMAMDGPRVLVHGGGKEISAALERYGQPVHFIDGIRVTPPASMEIMEMVVCGRINKRLVARLVGAGCAAIGLSGVDLGLVRAQSYRLDGHDLGRVGSVASVDVPRLLTLLAAGWLPIIAPVGLGATDGLAYNINADHMALGIAAALAGASTQVRAVELVFVSNVPGVMLAGEVAPRLSAAQIEQAIATGAVYGGMIPKVRSALAALAGGVAAVRIVNLAGLAAGAAGGTRIVQQDQADGMGDDGT